ncbi:MAG: gliding motility-associated C-terminal domain-containing protein [Bacteroidota bacterium]
MKKLLTSIFLILVCSSLFSQIKYEIELLPDNETYLISFVSSNTYAPPQNKVASGQVTIRMPHGIGVNAFSVVDLTMETPGASWQANDIIRAPVEAPSWDYFSFGLTTAGVDVYDFQAGVSVPVFSFRNGGAHCADSVYIIDNETDPLIDNSLNVDVRNFLSILAGFGTNFYDGTVGTGAAPGTPETLCTDETVDERIGCDSVMYQGITYDRDTTIDIHYTSSVGCDSVLVTEIIIQEELFATVDTTICEGDIFKGIEILQDDVIDQTYTTAQGCDSTVTYLIRLVEPTESETNLTVLTGDIVNGVAVFSDSTVIATLTNANGCDSVATVHVSVYSGQPTFISDDICLGESYNGIFYLQDTTFTDTLVSVSGFDSLLVYDLAVNEAYYITAFANLCAGEPHPTTGVVYENDTTFVENFQTVFGCDSNITTTIHVTVPEYFISDTSICFGELYQGVLYEEDIVFTESIPSLNGCDSVVTEVFLTVEPPVTASIAGVAEICEGDETILTATGGTQFLWSNGSTNNFITATGAGTFQVTVTNSAGCTNETAITVTASGLSVETEIEHLRCHDDLSGSINFTDVTGGFEPYIYSVTGGDFFATEAEFSDLSAGEYSLQVQDQFGCYWEDIVEIITPEEVWVEVSDGEEVRLGGSAELQATTNLFAPDSIIWSPAAGLACPTCLGTAATPLKTTNYTVTVIDENGCSAEASVNILVRPVHEMYVPNAFSPNGDGNNDTFTVFGGDNVAEVRQLAVFERWGGQVFKLEKFAPNNLSTGWNGLWRNTEAPEGVYIWMAEVEFIDGKVIVFEGEVNLMR